MTTITTYAGKGSQLTTAEVDANFNNLNNDKAENSDLDNKAANGANSDITSLSAITSINGGPLSGLRNKLIGGHFDTNPWQRGTSFTVTATGTYVADRWRVDFDGTANISVEKVALATPQVINGVFCRYGLKLTVNSKSGNTYIRISQRIEGADTLTTLSATLQSAIQGSASFSIPVNARQSFGSGGSPSSDVVTAMTAALAVTSSMQQLNTGLAVPDVSGKSFGAAADDFLAVEYDLMNIPASGYVVMALSGLECGNQATVWEDRRRLELDLCQRYLPVIQAGDSVNEFVLYGQAISSTTVYYTYALPVEARAAPTGMIATPGNWRPLDAGINNLSAFTTFAFRLSGKKYVNIRGVTSGGLVAGNISILNALVANETIIFTGCEL